MKYYVVCCLLLLLNAKVLAQSLSAGIAGGIASTDVTGIDNKEALARVGVVAGGFLNRAFNDRVALQLELLYVTRGSLQPADSSNNFFFYKLRLDYLEIPVLFKYKMHLIVNSESLDKLEVEAGPSIAMLLSSSQENNYGAIAFDREFNTLDFLFNLGLNYYFTSYFSFDLRFTNSIVPIRQHSNNTTYLLNKGEYNLAFNYTLRYAFH